MKHKCCKCGKITEKVVIVSMDLYTSGTHLKKVEKYVFCEPCFNDLEGTL